MGRLGKGRDEAPQSHGAQGFQLVDGAGRRRYQRGGDLLRPEADADHPEVGIAGDGASDLDLFVYDENDHLVCRSTASTDREHCRWWPRWTGPFRIEIQNLGAVADLYRLATN